jgi:hypothetical protein
LSGKASRHEKNLLRADMSIKGDLHHECWQQNQELPTPPERLHNVLHQMV